MREEHLYFLVFSQLLCLDSGLTFVVLCVVVVVLVLLDSLAAYDQTSGKSVKNKQKPVVVQLSSLC